MKRFFRLLDHETKGLHQIAFLLAFLGITGKILALLRDRLLASIFGAGRSLDIYYASFRIPDFLYVFSLFLVSLTAVLPLFLAKQKKSFEESRIFINKIFTAFFVLMIIVLTLTFFAIPFLAPIVAPGFSAEEKNLLIKLSRILLLSPFLLGLSNLISSIIQAFNRFLIYALTGILYNLGIIIGIIIFYPLLGLKGIVLGVLLGAFLHFFVQVPSLIRLHFVPRFVWKPFIREFKQVASLSFPRTLGLTLNQIVLTIITALASFLGAGSIAVFNLANNLRSIPLGIIGLSYSVAAFPDLARNFIDEQREKFISSTTTALKNIFFWLLPISMLFIVLRAQIVRVILGAGAFGWADTRLTAASLALFSLSISSQGGVLLLVRAFYAAAKTKLPLILNLISSAFIITFSVFFLKIITTFPETKILMERLLRVKDVPGSSMLVLPLSYSLGSILNFFLLWAFFEKEFGCLKKSMKKSIFQIIGASLFLIFTTYFSLLILNEFLNTRTFIGIFFQGAGAGIIGLISYFVFLKILKNKEVQICMNGLKHKFFPKIKNEKDKY